ncbi:O-antigen ligase family protein [Corallincola spongiicola]|uniref:O-antigen ligase family protein n=1 Tax=Corallincola spongiicola TaxID=2520508 RepID=A0ABY1WSN3_9GAMM|nr:O-antigen ligase family protein [Corallincola spongiicola]TAA47754.1 O-antigen ligase family protein [Corallincola spongiicola]
MASFMQQANLSRVLISAHFLLLMLITRCSLDPILNMTKVGGIGIGALLNLAVIAYGVVAFSKYRREIPLFLVKTWGIFLASGIISIILSPVMMQSVRSFASVVTYFVIFSLPFFLVRSRDDAKFLLRLIMLSSIIPIFYGLFEFVVFGGTNSVQGKRIFSTFSHPNIFAFYLVLVLSLSLFFLKSTQFKMSIRFRKWMLNAAIFGLVLLVLTKTRSAWAAFVMVVLVYGIMSEKKYLLYLAVAGGLAMLIPSIQERIVDIFSGNDADSLSSGEALNSYAWRKVVWESSWSYIENKPFLGHGYDTFKYYFLGFFPLEGEKIFDAHNVYVQIVFDMGFLGVLGYFCIFSCVLYRLFKYRRYDPKGGAVLIGLVCSYMLVGYSDNMLFYLSFNWYFWLVCGIFCALANRPELFTDSSENTLKTTNQTGHLE